jgi:hypothetical protein
VKHIERTERIERTEHIERIERIDRIELIERIERIERIDPIEPIRAWESRYAQASTCAAARQPCTAMTCDITLPDLLPEEWAIFWVR